MKEIRLNLPIFDESIGIKGFTLLVVENRSVLTQLVQWLYCYDESSDLKLYDSKIQSLKNSEIIVISDLLGFTINSSAVVKAIQTDLLDQFNDNIELKNELEQVLVRATNLVGSQCIENELNLTYTELSVEKIISALDVRVDTVANTLFEQIFEILQIFRYLVKKKLLIFVNVASYFKEEEIDVIKEFIELNQINVLFIEPRRVFSYAQFVLDEDFIMLREL